MRRHALWLGLMVLALSAPSALAQCDDYTSVEYQVTDWWDGVSTVQILNITDYTVCDYGGGGGGGYYDPSGGGGSAPTVSLSASIAWVDTTDPNNPIVAVDVSTANTDYDPVAYVMFEVSGATMDYTTYSGDARYQFDFEAIYNYGEGNTGFDGKVCTESGVCSVGGATITRFSPSPTPPTRRSLQPGRKRIPRDPSSYPRTTTMICGRCIRQRSSPARSREGTPRTSSGIR